MSDIFPTLQMESVGEAELGAVTRADLEFEVVHPPMDDEPVLRITNLLMQPRRRMRGMLAPSSYWRTLFDAGKVMTRPSAAVRNVLLASTKKSTQSTWAHHYFILDQAKRLHEVAHQDVRRTIEAYQAPLSPSEGAFGPFLVELTANTAETDLDALLAKFRQSLAPLVIDVGPLPPLKTSASIGAVIIRDAPTPEERATARREAILAQARAESWPESDTVGLLLGSATPAAGRQRATRMRASGELLGLWSPGEKTFYHPRIQFMPGGNLHPKWPELLAALANATNLSAETDRNGWSRYGWLSTPRGSLSERDLAEAASEDGIAPDEAHLSAAPRTPLEVFAVNPDAAIQWIQAQAEAARDRR